jgi:hypothetical protein
MLLYPCEPDEIIHHDLDVWLAMAQRLAKYRLFGSSYPPFVYDAG